MEERDDDPLDRDDAPLRRPATEERRKSPIGPGKICTDVEIVTSVCPVGPGSTVNVVTASLPSTLRSTSTRPGCGSVTIAR